MKFEKAYDASKFENGIYKKWEAAGAFKPSTKKGAKPFTIMMPPPNATGTLHLGHAVMLALEDIMVRFHRMKGDSTLWLPGTDHASIATQNKVEKVIAAEGATRHTLGRKVFLKRVDQFVKGSQKTIRNQVRKMGSSCDWSRERYTFEPDVSTAVSEVFVRMYNDGLIYRGHRIVNWCPRCESTLADDEVNYKEERTQFYYLKYGPFVIGTVRPETKFLDKVIIVNPDDARYHDSIGKKMMVPWIDGDVEATIIADKAADMEFGTGAMTITPAHDFIDFDIAKRHNLDIIQIIDEKGNLNHHAGEYAGQNARAIRKKLVAKMTEKVLVDRIEENYVHNIALCYRCDTPIEPLVSRQWFINVDKKFKGVGEKTVGKSLKERSIEVVRKKKIEIVPDRFEKVYYNWMENLHDWCISRQIWFGHQIPVWYCQSGCEDPIASTKEVTKCPKCKGKVARDPDTLDTWFSAGLWTFSTLGWPKNTPDLKKFHPTSVLETGYDILFFWVARMILMTQYALNDVPFKTVYLHGLVRTREGKKMSKSNPETCIDPLDMIAKYGADSLRLSMVIGGTPGNDLRLYEEKIAGFRNFVNKIWNASRFAVMQMEDEKKNAKKSKKAPAKKMPLSLSDKWILTRTQEVVALVTEDLEKFKFSDAGSKIYDFTWNEFCAWYLEFSKSEHKNVAVLTEVLETILKLIHPFVPYVTEAIWKNLGKKDFIMLQKWPVADKKKIFKKEAKELQVVVDTISAIRALRQENTIDIVKKIPLTLVTSHSKILEEKREAIERLGRVSELTIKSKMTPEIEQMKPTLRTFMSGVEIVLPVSELLDVTSQKAKNVEEIANVEKYIASLSGKLSNKNFVDRAPADIIAQDRARLEEAKIRLEKLNNQSKYL